MARPILIILIFLTSFSFKSAAQKQICITVDDLPTVTKFYNTPGGRDSLTRRLIAHLKQHQVPAVTFVIAEKLFIGSKSDPNQVKLLEQWLDAGMELGNHTFAHRGYVKTSPVEYQEDVSQGEKFIKPIVSKYGKQLRYFRHPYLQRGNTFGKLDSLTNYLKESGYHEAPVTVDNQDYLFSAAYEQALFRKNTSLAARIGDQYVDYMMASVHFYESQADSLFDKPIPHILLTHANAINSFYMGKLLSRLESDGYQFITMEKALQNPAYLSRDRFIGNAGISWIQRWALTRGKPESFCDGEPAIPAEISALANEK